MQDLRRCEDAASEHRRRDRMHCLAVDDISLVYLYIEA